jgi:hypothetical protein
MWTDFLFDYEGLKSFVSFLEPLLTRRAMAMCLKSIYIMAVRRLPRPTSFPLEATDAMKQPMRFGIGLYHMIPSHDPSLTEAIADEMSKCLDACAELGGRPYRYGWHQLSEGHHERFYGSSYNRLLELKRELDPDGLFQLTSSQFG